jgi:hypothetical protein
MSPKDMLKLERIWPKPLAMRMASAAEIQDVLSVVFENLDGLPLIIGIGLN